MRHALLEYTDQRCVQQLLSQTKFEPSISRRIDVLSRHFLGYSYRSNPLIGAADTDEVFTAALDGFDCVTYIETILALARASKVADFTESLRTIRYQQGRIEWSSRNHYMTLWIRNNLSEGLIGPFSTPGVPLINRERLLNVVPGLPVRRTCLRCVPKRAIARLQSYLQTGDLIFFASTRKNLDVFHTGILVHNGERLMMRHASRSQGRVVEQKLGDFIKANRMAGVIVVRPQEVTQQAVRNSIKLRRGVTSRAGLTQKAATAKRQSQV